MDPKFALRYVLLSIITCKGVRREELNLFSLLSLSYRGIPSNSESLDCQKFFEALLGGGAYPALYTGVKAEAPAFDGNLCKPNFEIGYWVSEL